MSALLQHGAFHLWDPQQSKGFLTEKVAHFVFAAWHATLCFYKVPLWMVMMVFWLVHRFSPG